MLIVYLLPLSSYLYDLLRLARDLRLHDYNLQLLLLGIRSFLVEFNFHNYIYYRSSFGANISSHNHLNILDGLFLSKYEPVVRSHVSTINAFYLSPVRLILLLNIAHLVPQSLPLLFTVLHKNSHL